MRALLLLGPAVLLGGCFVESLPEEPALLEIQVGLPLARTPAASPFNPWDSLGLFHLDDGPPGFPKWVKVTVETKDFTLKSGTWPSQERGIGDGEKPNGEVAIDLNVEAGAGRRLRALGFVLIGGQSFVYREKAVLDLDLVAGKASEAVLEMVPHESGTTLLGVRCEEGYSGPWSPAEAALVDAKALVLLPSRPLQWNKYSGKHEASFPLPVGRPHWVRVGMTNGTLTTMFDQRNPTFSATPGQNGVFDVVLPCGALR